MKSPYLEWAKLSSSAKYNLATSGIMGYPLSGLPLALDDLQINGPPGYGYRPLLERVARRYKVEPRCVVTVSGGTAMSNHLAMAAVLERGDDVLMEKPAYSPLLEVASYLGANILRFERPAEDGFRVDPDAIRSRLTQNTRLIVLTNLHNPSGAFTSEEVLVEIGRIAAAAGAWVLIDEVYLDMAFDAARSSFHLGDRFIVTNSLTKTYGMGGLRSGWVLARPQLAESIWRLNDLFSVSAPYPAELLSVIAMDHLDTIYARTKELLGVNRAALAEFLDSRSDLEVVRPAWGTICFPRLKHGRAMDFCELLRTRCQASVVPGDFFEMPQHFRLGVGGDPDMVTKALEQLGKALDEFLDL